MGGGDYEKSIIRNYIGNTFGLGAKNFIGNSGLTIPEGNNYGLGTNKFAGNFEINFPQGRILSGPVVGTSAPPPPPPPPDTDIECYVGNNFGLAGFEFAQPYTISSIPIYDKSGGEASDTPRPPSVPPPVIPPAYPTINPFQPPPGSDVDTFIGNKFDGSYVINIGGGQTPPNLTISSIPIHDKRGGEASNKPQSPSVPPPVIPPAYPTINSFQPPPGSDLDTYIGYKFNGRYEINIGGGQTPLNPTISVSPLGENISPSGNNNNDHSPGPSTYTISTGLVEIFCPICNSKHIFP